MKPIETINFSEVVFSKYTIENFITFEEENIPGKFFVDYPFSYDGIAFVSCLKGNGRLKINYKEYILEENSIITMTPTQIIELQEHSDDFLLNGLFFSQDVMFGLPVTKDFNILEKVITNPVLKLSKEDIRKVTAYHSFIVEVFNNNPHNYLKDIIKGLLLSLIYQIIAFYDLSKPEKSDYISRNEDITERFFLLLKDNYKTERLPKFYADKLFITTKYLSSILKKVTGRSINSWLEEAIILGAKLLLKSTDLTILQVSEELNFPNPSYFGRYFKKATGMTPKDYRES